MTDITVPNPRAAVTGVGSQPSLTELERRTRERAVADASTADTTEIEQTQDQLRQLSSDIAALAARMAALEVEHAERADSGMSEVTARIEALETQVEAP